MELRSSSLADGAPMDRRHAWPDCGGANLSPGLSWTGAPPGTASFVVSCFDIDAPRGWWHWMLYDLPAAATEIPEGGPLPDGTVETSNSFRAAGWGGPCPPPGKPHRYVFTVHALPDEHLPARPRADPGEVSRMATARALDAASLTATFRTP